MIATYSQRLLVVCLLVLLAGCASRSYQSQDVFASPFLERLQERTDGPVTVRTAVPTAEETLALTGLDLYKQGIQPVWLEVTNNSDQGARISHWSIDRHYFSPIEVAYMNKGKYAGEGYDDMEAWFHHNRLPRIVPAGETRKGFVFTNYQHGTKGFSLDVFANREAHSFTFFVPMPGFTPDFAKVDFATLYDPAEIRQLGDIEALRKALENDLPCCGEGPEGERNGAPFNVILVGTPRSVRRSLLRGDWIETTADDPVTAPARANHYRKRPPDGVFHKFRPDGSERIETRLWLSPWRIGNNAIWIGQIVYSTSDADRLIEYLTPQSPSADLDSAVRFILQDAWYNQSIIKAGYVKGVGQVPRDAPRESFSGHEYFTDGLRLVLQLSEEPVNIDEGRIIFSDTPIPKVTDRD